MIPVIPPMTNVTRNPTTKSSGVFHTGRPAHRVASHEKIWTPAGMPMAMLAAEKKLSDHRRQPDGEHVVRPQGERHEADGDEGRHDPPVAGQSPTGEHRQDHRHHARRPG